MYDLGDPHRSHLGLGTKLHDKHRPVYFETQSELSRYFARTRPPDQRIIVASLC